MGDFWTTSELAGFASVDPPGRVTSLLGNCRVTRLPYKTADITIPDTPKEGLDVAPLVVEEMDVPRRDARAATVEPIQDALGASPRALETLLCPVRVHASTCWGLALKGPS